MPNTDGLDWENNPYQIKLYCYKDNSGGTKTFVMSNAYTFIDEDYKEISFFKPHAVEEEVLSITYNEGETDGNGYILDAKKYFETYAINNGFKYVQLVVSVKLEQDCRQLEFPLTYDKPKMYVKSKNETGITATKKVLDGADVSIIASLVGNISREDKA